MPPWYYTLLHSRSKLSKAEKEQLVAGLPEDASPPRRRSRAEAVSHPCRLDQRFPREQTRGSPVLSDLKPVRGTRILCFARREATQEEEVGVTKRLLVAFLVAVTGTLVLATVGSGGTSKKQATPAARVVVLPARLQGLGERRSSSSPPTCPLQGARRSQTIQMTQAIAVHPERGRLEGRRLHGRLPVVRRRDRTGRQVGLGQVLGERQRVRP